MRQAYLLLLALLFASSSGAQEIDETAPAPDTSIILCTYVAGLKHHMSRKQYDALQLGGTLTLKAEPENKYDKHAIAIYNCSYKIGFIPAQEAESLSETLSAHPLIAVISKKGNEESSAAMSLTISVRRE